MRISIQNFKQKYKSMMVKDFAAELNVSTNTINYWARKYNLPKKNKKVTWVE